MAAWIEAIQTALEGVTDTNTDFAEPDIECGEHDHVVGVADPALRKICFLGLRYRMKALEAGFHALSLGRKPEEAEFVEAAMYALQAEVLKEMMWISCRHAFPELWNKSSIGIRKGWKVVWSEHEETIADFVNAFRSRLIKEALRVNRSGESGQDGFDPSRMN